MNIWSIIMSPQDKALIAAANRIAAAVEKLNPGQGGQGDCATKTDLEQLKVDLLAAIEAIQETSQEDQDTLNALLTRIQTQSLKLEALDRKT
jgi:CBS-domain-containing membrane protein